MGRPQRYIPENRDGVLVEVTVRTIGARALLVPAPNPRIFNEVVVGVIGRALEVAPVLVPQTTARRPLDRDPALEGPGRGADQQVLDLAVEDVERGHPRNRR